MGWSVCWLSWLGAATRRWCTCAPTQRPSRSALARAGGMAEPVRVAIVGMAAVFPGAPDLASFWSNITAGVDAITDVPTSRWDPSYYDSDAYDPRAGATRRGDRLYCRRGGFVQQASFDPTRYGIMPTTVEGAEPDQLLALHA